MKKFLSLSVTVLAACYFSLGQTNVSNNIQWPLGNGQKIYPYRSSTNTFPITRIAGENEIDEAHAYIDSLQEGRSIPEIMAADIDPNANWGALSDGMQVSVWLRQTNYFSGAMVPAVLILRNTGAEKREWWRNGYPDCGYHFKLSFATNTIEWGRAPQQRRKPNIDDLYSGPDPEHAGVDPFWFVSEPRTEDLTILYLNRFFDLSQTGKYSLQVQIQVPTSDGKGSTNLISGIAVFEISQLNSTRQPKHP
jgi:hypothetical protein